MEALRVSGGDGGANGLARSRLFFDSFEYDDVRVGCDADREHEAGESGERQRDVEDQDRRVQERRVDREPRDRDEAEEPVHDEQEQRDDEEADDRRVARLAQRVGAERRRDVRPLDRVEVHGEGAGLEHECQVLRLAQTRHPGDLRAAAGGSMPSGFFS